MRSFKVGADAAETGPHVGNQSTNVCKIILKSSKILLRYQGTKRRGRWILARAPAGRRPRRPKARCALRTPRGGRDDERAGGRGGRGGAPVPRDSLVGQHLRYGIRLWHFRSEKKNVRCSTVANVAMGNFAEF